MKIPLKTIVVFALAGLSGTLLLYTSQAVQDAQRKLDITTAELQKENETIDILKAEWAFLSAPERLQELADENLGLTTGDETAIVPSLRVLGRARAKADPKPQDASYSGEDAP